MEHEETYQLMMAALDGELTADGHRRLALHLDGCSRCAREWRGLLAIDQLFREAPLLAPAADFAQRTLGLIPSRRARLWLMGGIYLFLLVSGLVPLVVMVWAFLVLGPVITNPAFLGGLAQSAGALWAIVQTLLAAAGQIVADLGQSPGAVGVLLLMLGLIALWTGVYQQLITRPLSGSTQ